ncbi:MAG: methyltransferase [Pseudomonadota bacterium]
MTASSGAGARLLQAVQTGLVTWPEAARVAVFAPRAGMDLSALPKEMCHLLTRLRPDRDFFAGQGWDCARAPEGHYGAAVVFATRAKPLTQALIAEAARITDGMIVVDGTKTDGIESLLKACRARVAVSAPVSKAHGKLFTVVAAPEFDAWAPGAPQEVTDGFVTAPGVFSADGIDPASHLLAEALPETLGAEVVDLGAGWGYLAARVLERDGVEVIHLVEADDAALDCARRNVFDARARFHWQDATRWQPPAPVDCVVMNPPFHSGRAGDPGLGQAFIRAAAKMLKPRGQLFMVANRHLPYEAELAACFGQVDELGGDNRFKIFHATRPSRPRR